MTKINDLELAVRTIEEILPDMPNSKLQKWHSIFTTALMKLEQEMNSSMMHTCDVCGFEEYGYRTELPIAWREKGDLVICFNHEDNEIADILSKALEADEQHAKEVVEDSVEELLALL